MEIPVNFGTVALALLSLSATSFGIKKVFRLGSGMYPSIFILAAGFAVTGFVHLNDIVQKHKYPGEWLQFHLNDIVQKHKYPGEWLQLYDFIYTIQDNPVDEVEGMTNFKEKFECPDGLTQDAYNDMLRWVDTNRAIVSSRDVYKKLFAECVVRMDTDNLSWNAQ